MVRLLKWAVAMGLCLWLQVGMPVAGNAQEDAAAEDAAESRSEAFVAVEGAVKEDIAGGPLMLTAYAVTWVFLFAYVMRLAGLQNRTLREVERLSAELKRSADRSGEP